MLRAFKYRIYPTPSQEELINKHIGSVRFLYNLALETKQMAYAGSKVNLSRYEISAQIPELKKECPWLKEINSQSLQQALVHMDTAFNNFFKGQAEFPRFKSKSRSRQSFCVPQSVSLDHGKLCLPKFKKGIEVVEHRPLKGEIRQATISRTPTGKYFASILVETGVEVPIKKEVRPDTTVGIDLGLKALMVGSDGFVLDNPRHLRKAMDRLKWLQSRYSRYKGKNRKQQLAKLHEKVANQRHDLLHKASATLVKNHDSIAIEDLNIKGMVRNHCLAQSISDAAWGTFVQMLEYKAEWHGKNILRIGRFEPSSKTCSDCGWIHRELSLKEREWTCRQCGVVHDRDINAAMNTRSFALEKHINNLCGTQSKTRSEPPTLVGVLTSEAHGSLAHG